MPSNVLHQALKFAYKHHKKQDRDPPEPLPYLTHVVDVVNILRYEGGETAPDLICAAFLHDVLEETDATTEEINDKFGAHVAQLVQELTRDEPSEEIRASLPADELWELRNQLLLDGISRMSPDAQKVKLADRVSNLRGALATREGERLEKYIRQSKLILERIPKEVNPNLWALVAKLAGGK